MTILNFVRAIANSNELVNIVNIPSHLRDKKVEIIILPLEDKEDVSKKTKSLRGVLSKYKDLKLIERESDAFREATVEKHEDNRR